jgi:hypothetical protein
MLCNKLLDLIPLSTVFMYCHCRIDIAKIQGLCILISHVSLLYVLHLFKSQVLYVQYWSVLCYCMPLVFKYTAICLQKC